ncbi:bestrophin family protein [Taibaiella soli]|uniref:Multidrug transporter n=1 Tax=Taibaiella soli TaxID=1649169 RepID=A0A2W2AW35_9BACT|nr:bestrophin family ion channel [Taibaiella soli]PZF71898.1 multidrug transporter [Taibaiella soli]
MYIGKSYNLAEFLVWTRRTIFRLLLIATIPTVLYQVFDIKWLSVPWTVVGLLGTATAFVVGFKNQQTYNRTWEARQIWGAAMSTSRGFAMMCRDFISDPARTREIIYRHFAWLTAVRYQLRADREWEAVGKAYNKEYRKYYTVPEEEIPIETELAKYMTPDEIKEILSRKNPATQLLSIQSQSLAEMTKDGLLEHFRFLEIHSVLRELTSLQGKSERIKNFPYPRQYATINTFFVNLFCILLPFAMLKEFNELNDVVTGFLKGYMVWLVIPFSTLISWVYTSLDQVGESTENPFEGNANDVPISQMSRNVEIDIREMLGETDLPSVIPVKNNIVM